MPPSAFRPSIAHVQNMFGTIYHALRQESPDGETTGRGPCINTFAYFILIFIYLDATL